MKQLAEKLATAADLLKYSPHSEITDVHQGICVNICNLLSMPFSSYLPPIRSSSLLPGHPLPESLSSFFPKERASPTSPNRGHILFHSWRKGSAFLLPLTIRSPLFSPLLHLPLLTLLQPHQSPCYSLNTPSMLWPQGFALAELCLKSSPPEGHVPPSLPYFNSSLKSHILSESDFDNPIKNSNLVLFTYSQDQYPPSCLLLFHGLPAWWYAFKLYLFCQIDYLPSHNTSSH